MIMTIDPFWRFIVGTIVTFAIGVSQGTVVLSNAIPDPWIKPVVAWCGILAFLGSALTTALTGLGMTTQNRIASAAAVPEVKSIVTTQVVADASPSRKVVSTP
jgi:hypothetical protein